MASRGWGVGGGAWVWRRRLFAWEEECVTKCCALLHDIVLHNYSIDRWKWLLDPVHGYTVKGAYQLLTSVDEPPARGLFDNVWHKHVPLKVSLFAWRLLRNRLPTKDNLVRRRVLQHDVTNVLEDAVVRSLLAIYFYIVPHSIICGFLFRSGYI